MKPRFFITSIFIVFAAFCFAQTETLNQFDAAGKKDGKWILWLNNIWREVKDSSESVYCRYTRYDHGDNIYPMAMWGAKNWKLESVNGNNPQIGNIKLLDGDYKWIDNKGVIRSTHKFVNGECVVNKFFNSSGTLYDIYDYTKQWNGLAYTWLITQYDKKGNIKYFYSQKYKGKWQAVQDFTDSIEMDTIKIVGDSTFATSRYFLKGKLTLEKGVLLIRTPQEQLGQFTQKINHGKFTGWYSSGQKGIDGQYYYGQKTGDWKYWDEMGNERIPEKENQ